MYFQSWTFAFFFLAFFPGYFVFNQLNVIARNLWIIAGGLLFCASFSRDFLWVICVHVFINGYFLYQIGRTQSRRLRALWLTLGLIFGFLFLGSFKYSGLSLGWSLAFPIGLSFYTFQTAGFLIDRFHNPSQRFSLLDFAATTSFFPHFQAGPIARTSFVDQIRMVRPITAQTIEKGVWLLLMGFYKKLIVADSLAPIVSSFFSNPEPYSSLAAASAVLAFSLQIYFDFSAYTDIARGLGSVMGFQLDENFASPYWSRSPGEFWRRWHISLSQWLRDYIYIPLGGSHRGTTRTLFNLISVMIICGLWHGSSWMFLLWGIGHGVLLAIERLWSKCQMFAVPQPVSALGTFVVVSLLWVFFASPNLDVATSVFQKILTGQGGENLTAGWTTMTVLNSMVLLGLIDGHRHWTNNTTDWLSWPPIAKFGFGIFFAVQLLFHRSAGHVEFLYNRF